MDSTLGRARELENQNGGGSQGIARVISRLSALRALHTEKYKFRAVSREAISFKQLYRHKDKTSELGQA